MIKTNLVGYSARRLMGGEWNSGGMRTKIIKGSQLGRNDLGICKTFLVYFRNAFNIYSGTDNKFLNQTLYAIFAKNQTKLN